MVGTAYLQLFVICVPWLVYLHIFICHKNAYLQLYLSLIIHPVFLYALLCAALKTCRAIEQFHKSQSALDLYPAMLHSENKCVHFCSEWSNVGFETGASHICVLNGALWDIEQVHSGICWLDQFTRGMVLFSAENGSIHGVPPLPPLSWMTGRKWTKRESLVAWGFYRYLMS